MAPTNPAHPQYPQPHTRRIIDANGIPRFFGSIAGPDRVDMLGAGAGDTSSPDLVVHPAFSACLLPKRRPLNVPFPKPEPKTTAEEQKLRNPPRSMDACGWPVSAPRASLDALLSETQKPGAEMKLGKTLSMAVIQRGSLVGHIYGPTSSPTTRLVSWSMAKSFVHAMLGVLVLRGILPFDLEVEAPLPEWKVEGQKGVTMRQLVEMRSGRAWAEDYVEGDQSDVIQMLFRQGASSPPTFALSKPLLHPPGSAWYYSSGTSNILCLCISRLLPPSLTLHSFFTSLLTSIGMVDATPRNDANGIFIGSSFLYASALSFARMGLLYMRDGVWDGKRILPSGWADTARVMQAGYPEGAKEVFGYSWHFWVWLDEKVGGRWGAFSMNGHEGQFVVCVPKLDLIVVRLGKTPSGPKSVAVLQHIARVIDSFADTEEAVAREQGWDTIAAKI